MHYYCYLLLLLLLGPQTLFWEALAFIAVLFYTHSLIFFLQCFDTVGWVI